MQEPEPLQPMAGVGPLPPLRLRPGSPVAPPRRRALQDRDHGSPVRLASPPVAGGGSWHRGDPSGTPSEPIAAAGPGTDAPDAQATPPGKQDPSPARIDLLTRAYRWLAQQFPRPVVIQAFLCPRCGRQSAFRSDEAVHRGWCGYAPDPDAALRARVARLIPPRRRGSQVRQSPTLALDWDAVSQSLSLRKLLTLVWDTIRMVVRNEDARD
jgi:hypothetical protein